MKKYLQTRVIAKFILPVSVLVLIIIFVAGFFIAGNLQTQITQSAENETKAVKNSIIQNLEITNSIMLDKVKTAMQYLVKNGQAAGQPSVGGQVQVGKYSVPELKLGGKSQIKDYEIVDKIKSVMNSTATIFVKSGSDFVRISTNVLASDGSRAIGTVLDPNGKAYSAVIKGEAFYGVVDILGKPYLTGYVPIMAANGEVLGIWYVGYQISTLKILGDMIAESKFLTNGFFVLTDGKSKVIFNSLNADKSVLEAISKDDIKKYEDDWVIGKSTFDKWGYKIFSAFPKDDIGSQITKAELIIALLGLLTFGIMIALISIITNKIILNPVKKLVSAAEALSEGNVEVEIQTANEDEIGSLEKAFRSMVENIKTQAFQADKISKGELDFDIVPRSDKDVLNISLLGTKTELKKLLRELSELTESITNGKLSVRVNCDEFSGGYKEIITGVNDTLDAVIKPLNVAAEYVDRISKGDIPKKIVDDYKGDFNEIKTNLNLCIETLNGFVDEMSDMYVKQKAGDIDAEISPDHFRGVYKKMAQGVNEAVKLHVENVLKMLNVLADYANGELETTLEKLPGKQALINEKLDILKNNLQNVISEINKLTHAASEGELSVRGGVDSYHGAYKEVISGINNILDTVIKPLNTAASSIELIGRGEIPERITEEYKGEYNLIKKSINSCVDGLNGLVETSSVLEKMSYNDFANRVRGNYEGIYARTAESVNRLIDRLTNLENILTDISQGNLTALEELQRIAKRSENDRLIPSVIGMMKSIKGVITDINELTIAASNGELSKRADLSIYQGEFKSVIAGVNNTVDAVVQPLSIALVYVKKIADGDLSAYVSEEFKGDFSQLKENLNLCIKSINRLINDANMLSNAAVEGDLALRADTTAHKGGYKEIIKGVNDTLDAMIAPINEGVEALKIMSQGDFTLRINSSYKGSHQLIKDSINKVVNELCKALSGVSDAVKSTTLASNKISASTEEMAAGANEQSQQTFDIASSIEEMTKTILENTKNAANATETAEEAGQKAKEGGKVVKETIEGMNKISEVVKQSAIRVQELGKESDQIGEIIRVIDDIADQTNLLALNAAIEAARAGEQGRGFAVVADEVRKLAEKTTKATKEIEEMIKRIQRDTGEAVRSMDEGDKEVEKGKKLAYKAGESLEEIIEVSDKVVDIVSLVAAASEEQSSAAGEISQNIDSISNVSRETTEGIQQIAKAAEDLNNLTFNLEQLVNKFKIQSEEITKA